jgi:hypothetical protein
VTVLGIAARQSASYRLFESHRLVRSVRPGIHIAQREGRRCGDAEQSFAGHDDWWHWFKFAIATKWAVPLASGLSTASPRTGRLIEYDHLFIANNFFSVPAGTAAVVDQISQDVDMATLRVSHKFGGPVVAR